MHDSESAATAIDPGDGPVGLAGGAARVVQDVPAVTRLEPSLLNALHRLPTPGQHFGAGSVLTSAADGVTIRRRGSLVDVHVDVTVSPVRPANRTAAEIQQALRRYLLEQQLSPGVITVAVLTLDR